MGAEWTNWMILSCREKPLASQYCPFVPPNRHRWSSENTEAMSELQWLGNRQNAPVIFWEKGAGFVDALRWQR